MKPKSETSLGKIGTKPKKSENNSEEMRRVKKGKKEGEIGKNKRKQEGEGRQLWKA